MKIILSILLSVIIFTAKAQFTGTDSLRNYNNKYVTNNPATSFTNLRLNTLLRGIIDWVDTARAGTGGGGALGVDTLWALNDSTIRYRKGGVFRNMILKGVYDTRRKVDSIYKVNDTTIGFKINGTARTIIIPGRAGMNLANSALTANGDYDHNWAQHYLSFDSVYAFKIERYAPDALFPTSSFNYFLRMDSTINQYPFRAHWSFGYTNNSPDSIWWDFGSTRTGSFLYNVGANGYGLWDFVGNSTNPRLSGTLFGNSKTSTYNFGHVTQLKPADSIQLKAVPAATADSILAVRAFSSGMNTVIKIPVSAVGSSATLSNVGSGYRLVKTADGQVKTIFVGYGVIADSSTNTNGITLKADTSSTNHIVTQSDLNDAIAGSGSGISGLTSGRVVIATSGTTIGDDAGFTYNSTTNKLSADSLLIKKGLADSLMMGAYESDYVDSSTFFGTSITAGTDAKPVTTNRYSALVAAGLRTIEVNKGQGGYLLQHSPSWPLDNTFKDHYTALIQPKTTSSRYMFMAWGENDATNEQMYGGLFNVDTSFFKRDYGIVVNYAVSLGWSLNDIIIISPFYQLTTTCPLAMQQKYVDASHHFADSMGLKWIDVFTQGKNYNSAILVDYIHPSNYGHSLHAYTVLKGMSQLLQARSGENLINPYTTLLNEVKFFGKDTANVGYALAGVNPNGSLTKIPSERYLLMDNTNAPVQSGNASVLGNINAGKIVRAMGQNSITTGAGFEMSYDGANGILLPANWSGPSFGNIVMPFSKLTVGNSFTSPWAQLYVDGLSFGKGLFSSDNPNETYNTITNSQTLNFLVRSDSIGSILLKGVSGYRPISFNGGSTQPIYINTFTDNGSGARLQVNGDATVADEAYDATAWNGSLEVPTKNAVRDKIETLSGATTIYNGDGTLAGNRVVTGNNLSLTLDDIFAFKINSDYNTIAKANGTGIYSEAVVGAGNVYEIGFTPVAGVFSKGAGVFIDSNNNVGIGTQAPTGMPLYATGASLFVQGLQSNHGNYYKVNNVTTDLSASLQAYFYTIDATAGNVTVTLPAASTAFGNTMGITYKFQRIDNSGNTVTVQRAGSDTINGGTSFTLTAQYQVKQMQCTSTSAWAQW